MDVSSTIDNSKNRWPGTVSTADLAVFTKCLYHTASDIIDIFAKEWKFEIEKIDVKANTISFNFKDGSRLTFEFN